MYKADDDVFIWNEFLAGNDRAYEFIYNKYAQTLFTSADYYFSNPLHHNYRK